MSAFEKVVFVCNGNTCRSPMAATIMSNVMPKMLVCSRGMVVLFPEPYNQKAVAVASKFGYIMPNNSAQQLTNDDFGDNVLVLAMDNSMKQKIYDEFIEAVNVYTISEYAREPDTAVEDPYGKGASEYSDCFQIIERLVKKIAAQISDDTMRKGVANEI